MGEIGAKKEYWRGARHWLIIYNAILLAIGIGSLWVLRNFVGKQLESAFYSNQTDIPTYQRFSILQEGIKTSTQFVTLENGDKISYLYKPKADNVLPDEKRIVIIVGGLPGIDPHWVDIISKINNRSGVIVIHPAGYEPSTGEKTNHNIQNSLLNAVPLILESQNLQAEDSILVAESAGASAVDRLIRKHPFQRIVFLKPMISPLSSLNKIFDNENSRVLFDLYKFCVNYTPPIIMEPKKVLTKEIVISIGGHDKLVQPEDQLAVVSRLKSQRQKEVYAFFDPKADHFTFDPKDVTKWILASDLDKPKK